VANSYRLDDPAYAHVGGDAETDFLADTEPEEGSAADPEPVLVGAKLLELRKLSRRVRDACCAAGLSATETDDHCAEVWDDLHRLRNVKAGGLRRTLTVASLELRASGRATHPHRTARAADLATGATADEDDGTATATPATAGRGKIPPGQCRGWWFNGTCSFGDRCPHAATHTEEARGTKKKGK
jgi:hypothetical protein